MEFQTNHARTIILAEKFPQSIDIAICLSYVDLNHEELLLQSAITTVLASIELNFYYFCVLEPLFLHTYIIRYRKPKLCLTLRLQLLHLFWYMCYIIYYKTNCIIFHLMQEVEFEHVCRWNWFFEFQIRSIR